MDEIMKPLITLVSVIVVPYLAWVTTSIFALRQQVALLKQEIAILDDIKAVLVELNKKI